MHRSYRFRLYPTPSQTPLLEKHFGCVRWVYNWGLQMKTEHYQTTGKALSVFDLNALLPDLKRTADTCWLKEVNAQSLQCALRNLDTAFTRFFREKEGYPKFKARRNYASFQAPQRVVIDWGAQRIFPPKFPDGIRCAMHRQVDGKVKTCTFSRTPTGKYYVSVVVEAPDALPPRDDGEAHAVGIDMGVKTLVVTSDGDTFANPKSTQRHLRRLQIRHRRLERKTKGSKNRDKARLRVARVHERISDSRNDNLHKISHALVRKSHATTLCLEDLHVSALIQKSHRGLSGSIQDTGWRELRRQIEYKAKWRGKTVRVIGQFEASSKTCSCCGHVKRDLTLSDREWTCVCGATHDRDVNAAQNVKQFAYRGQNTYAAAGQPSNNESIPRGTRKSTPVEQSLEAAANQECQQRQCHKVQ